MTRISASRRGTARNSIGSMPMTLRASISSETCMVAISAAIDEPERPATRMAVMSGPISRTTETAVRSAT